MMRRLGRRTLLQGLGYVAGAGAAASLFHPLSSAEAQSAFEQLTGAARLRIADMALDLGRQAGASYADLRICRYRWQNVTARDGQQIDLQSGVQTGVGIRLLVDGAWGFAATDLVDEANVRLAVRLAVENAAAIRFLEVPPVVLEPLRAYRDVWKMPMSRDPFGVADDEKVGLLLGISEAGRKAGANFTSAYLQLVKEEKFFASSIGSQIDQSRVRVEPGFRVTAVDKSSGRFTTCDSLAPPRGAGWEYVLGLGLASEAAAMAPKAREKLTARPVAPGTYDLVVDASNLWLTLHETVGHATELDRALGAEANYAGTSFVTPAQRGALQFGSPLMNVVADRSQIGGLSTVGYDDDGVKCADNFSIIRDGIFQNYQMAIGQAGLIGETQSNGCAYSDGPGSIPIQRMPNISLLPSPNPGKLDDLIAGVDEGILIIGPGSWSIDQQRQNFQFGGQLFYEIKHGVRGRMLRDVAYQAQSVEFWNAMDGLGDGTTYFLGGSTNCSKGEPMQRAAVSHGAVPARFRRIAVLNTDRADI